MEPSATTLGRATANQAKSHSDESAFLLLDTGREAFHHRIALADAAESSIDAQYYIWNADTAGRLLAERLLRAAERGVRVRLLLDDVGVGGKDHALILMDAHPNIQVRVYNPFRRGFRGGLRKWLRALLEFDRINRRMHSKVYIVDNNAAIIGGRNIGDEYFDRDPELNFRDRDLLSLGPVAEAASASFQAYWDSDWAYPVRQVIGHRPAEAEIIAAREKLGSFAAVAANDWPEAPNERQSARAWLNENLDPAEWARAELIADPPGRKGDPLKAHNHVVHRLLELLDETDGELLIESAYFNLHSDGIERLEALSRRGVKTRVITNSLASTDMLPVHAGYSGKRGRLLNGGVGLYEFRPDAASCLKLLQDNERCADGASFGLHAKTVVFDRRVAYVGSFNVTPRSVYLNSEAALIVHSPALASRIADDIEQDMAPENSWRVQLNEQGDLEWRAQSGDQETHDSTEPATTAWQRWKARVLSVLPLDTYY